MKRSKINTVLNQSKEFIESKGFMLPPLAYLTPDLLISNYEINSNFFNFKLGWDITDYGTNLFESAGLTLFTVINGNNSNKKNNNIPYAEKIMISREDQISPMHRHIEKTEDIINRGGGFLCIEMFSSNPQGNIDLNKPISFLKNSEQSILPAGSKVILEPGESVTLFPGNWHKFWGHGGDVLIGEVSSINDDNQDNVFLETIPRFTAVEEDADPIHLLVSDYEKYLVR